MAEDKNTIERTESRTVNGFIIAMALVSIVVLGYLVISNITPNLEKSFSTEAFYAGREGTVPKTGRDWVETVNGQTLMVTERSCNTAMWKASNTIQVAGASLVWLSTSPVDREKLQLCNTAGEISCLDENAKEETAIYRMDEGINGSYIIAPCDLHFVNTNIQVDSSNRYYIQAIAHSLNGNYRITWKNVKCWWCHIGKENVQEHDRVYGGGQPQGNTAVKGYIIGEAQSGTKVIVEYREDTTTENWVPASLAEFYGFVQRTPTNTTE